MFVVVVVGGEPTRGGTITARIIYSDTQILFLFIFMYQEINNVGRWN